jgi:hypothetical protein
MKIVYNEGPQTIRTDEVDFKLGIPEEVSEELGNKMLSHPVYVFTKISVIDDIMKKVSKKKKEVENGST